MKNAKFNSNVIKLLSVLFFVFGASFAEAKVDHSKKRASAHASKKSSRDPASSRGKKGKKNKKAKVNTHHSKKKAKKKKGKRY
jgi:hypothetical protein